MSEKVEEKVAKAGSYYFDQLNKEQQRAYYAMKEGLLNLQDSFAVPMLSNKELSDIYFMIRLDCPEIFYSVTFTYKYYPDSSAVEMVPQYLFTKNKIMEKRRTWFANLFRSFTKFFESRICFYCKKIRKR